MLDAFSLTRKGQTQGKRSLLHMLLSAGVSRWWKVGVKLNSHWDMLMFRMFGVVEGGCEAQ